MSHFNQLKAVVFDFDGLMVNTEQIYDEVGDELLGPRGRQFSSELKDQMMGRPAAAAIQVMIDFHSLDDSVQDLIDESDEIFNRILPLRLKPMPGLFELLEELMTASIPFGIATSSRPAFVNRALELVAIDASFQFILTGEDVVNGKPHPEIYHKAVANLELTAEGVLVLEDSEIGCRAAVAAGTRAVAVPGEHSRHHNFSGAEFVADTLADRRIYDLLRLG